MSRSRVVGIMGPGEATKQDLANAEKLGYLIGQKGWITLTGGRPVGVMDAALSGAKRGGGLTMGILTGKNRDDASASADIVIATGMGSGRNIINVLSSDVVVACGMGAGTASEIALAIKGKKQVILLTDHQSGKSFFKELSPHSVTIAETPEDVITAVERLFA